MKLYYCVAASGLLRVTDSETEEIRKESELPEKKRLMRQFLDLDPTGAGSGAARQYWTTWGVDPDA